MLDIIPLLLGIISAVAVGLLTWALIRLHQDFLRTAEARAQQGRVPLFFRIAMPYIKAFSKWISDYHSFVSPADTSRGVTQTVVDDGNLLTSALDWIYLRTHKKLRAAGSPLGFEAEECLGFRIFGIVLGIAIGGLMWVLTSAWYLFPAFVVIGAVLPPWWLNDMVAARQARIKKELPFALDLLTLSVESGMDFTSAMADIVENLKDSPLSQEFDLVYKEINMGRQRGDALRGMSERVNLFEINTVVSALIQADELGTGLGDVLRIQAEEVRRRRFEAAEKRAQQAPVKMLFPLVIFIFPATLLTIASPLLVVVIQKLILGESGSWF